MISIIIPVYNVEEFIEECIESVIDQDYRDLQILLVDDGSTDRSGEICDRYTVIDKRIEVIHQKNQGVSVARNIGLKHAKGEYIGFVDGDDYIEKDMYYRLLTALKSEDADIACCARYEGDKTRHSNVDDKILFSHEALLELLLGEICDTSVCDKMFKKSLFLESDISFPAVEINEEMTVTPVLFQKAKKIAFTGKPLYHYCPRNSSVTHSVYTEKNGASYKQILLMQKFIKENDPLLYEYTFNVEFTSLIGLLGMMELDSAVRQKYEDDYKRYKFLFDNDYSSMMHSKCVKKWVKLRAFLTRHHIYNCIKTLVKR